MHRYWIDYEGQKYYEAWIDLDQGKWTMSRKWGGIENNHDGGDFKDFNSKEKAEKAMEKLHKRRLKRGYIEYTL